ncbi:hypothetical protein HPS58_06680 [Prevotella sp. PJ1A]|jgi:hypothetical protein|uniref:DUF5683 domain-containing protein n=2 Tax=Xylanibacter rodentium TaxID=2736289 RepID=A0ABX2AUG4_9BACT|nr:hypothetical protein [Prevotella sp. PJ1A]NPE13613.1 hypothetical protein [Xylanibacter rodentium]NPE38337.1 hypothetical protein [Prevotella sp. PCJ2]
MLTLGLLLAAGHIVASAQEAAGMTYEATPDTISADSLERMMTTAESVSGHKAKALKKRNGTADDDTLTVIKTKRDWATWTPNPQRALWLAMVLPGAGQIYNRKYWKLPIFYGGMMGCLYAMNWNNMMYKDYSQAYLDIMDDDPTTQSYNKFLHLGKQIDSSNEERYKKLFKSRKDRYRRWRDMSFFCLVGVYALSVIDAYVDAELSEFDISKDLSLKVEPAVIGGNRPCSLLDGSAALGLQCSLTF